MVSATTRLHRDDTRHQTTSKLDDTGPMHASTNDDVPAIVQSHDAAAILAEVNPENCNLHGTPPFLRLPSQRSAAGGGAGHSIKLCRPGGANQRRHRPHHPHRSLVPGRDEGGTEEQAHLSVGAHG